MFWIQIANLHLLGWGFMFFWYHSSGLPLSIKHISKYKFGYKDNNLSVLTINFTTYHILQIKIKNEIF